MISVILMIGQLETGSQYNNARGDTKIANNGIHESTSFL